MDILTREAMYV